MYMSQAPAFISPIPICSFIRCSEHHGGGGGGSSFWGCLTHRGGSGVW